MAISGAGLWLDVEGFFFLNMLGRVLSGCGSACLFTVAGTIIASDYPEKMTTYIGINESCAGLGVMLGPLVGTGLYELFGFRGIFFGLSCMFLVLSIIFFIWQGTDRPYRGESDESGFLSLLMQPRIAASLLPLAYAMLVIGALDVFLAPHLSTFGLSTGVIGLIFGLDGGTYVIATALLAYILGGFRLKTMNVLATILASGAILLVGPWPSFLPDSLILVLTGYIFLPVALSITFFEAIPCLLEVATKDLGMPNDDRLTDLVAGR
jgi:MFS family permease